VTAETRDPGALKPHESDSPTQPLRVAVFSNQELIRAGLASLLGKYPERATPYEPSDTVIAHDVIVFDLVSAVGDARAPALRQLQRLIADDHHVVAVTRDPSEDLATRARKLGCAAIVPVATTAEELVDVLESVGGQTRSSDDHPAPRRVLTRRETQIVELVAEGLSNTEIAQELFLSVNSVKTYIRTAYRKMGVTTRSQAVLWAVRGGLAADSSQQLGQEPPRA